MYCGSLCFLAAVWSAFAFASASASASASANFDSSGGSEFHMGVLLPRQQAPADLQVFTGALGGVRASAITNSGDPERPFAVDGDTFRDFDTAANRACDNQKNECANLANNGTGSFRVGDCDQQTEQCKSAASSATVRTFQPPELVSSNDEFDFFCDV